MESAQQISDFGQHHITYKNVFSLTDYIKSAFCSDKVLALTVSNDISPFFTYHGTRLYTTQVYTYPSDYTLPIGGNQKSE